ncbi:MAG: cytidylate kinase-like family protein [Bacteroidales bacterium]|nr:cytidylate kinase-like family protein [Bacteroidales bacterium]
MNDTNQKFIVNIGRQIGSGGLEIGRKLSELLQVDFYDKALLKMAAKESGLDSSYFEKADETPTDRLSFALFSNPLNISSRKVLDKDELFKMQSNVIREVARKKSCVIVGRTSDYILRDFPNSFNFFIHAPYEERLKWLVQKEKISERRAAHMIHKIDRQREHYYNYYTNKKWGLSASYHLSIDSSILGFEGTALLFKSFIEQTLLHKVK